MTSDEEDMGKEIERQKRLVAGVREAFKRECDGLDAILRLMGLSPDNCRTDGGSLKLQMVLGALEHRDVMRERAAVDATMRELCGNEAPFTNTSRAALLWVLWHHQGGSSPVGQPLRFALGMDSDVPLNDSQIREAQQWAKLTRSTTAEFHGSRVDGWGRPKCPTDKCTNPARDCYGSGCLSDEPQSAVAAAYGGLVQTPQG
jgi:hypothetical protein